MGKAAIIVFLPLAWCAPGKAQPADAAMRARSVVHSTDVSRLQRVFAKARRGEKVTVAVIGGSITAGANATTPEKRYANRMAQWWREKFPQAAVEFLNAGIGATGSAYGTLRAQRDLLRHQPDFVLVEFGVNDRNTREAAETLEGLLRQILQQPQSPAVMLLFMKFRGGANSQQWQSKLGAYYRLPMVSFRDAVQPEIAAGRMQEVDVMGDDVHPNDRGHQLTGEIVTHYLNNALQAAPAVIAQPAIEAVPEPLLTDLFERVRFYDGANLQPTENRGWAFDAPSGSWIARTPGAILKCEVEGTLIQAVTFRIKGPMGRVRVQVDNAPSQTLEGWFSETWGFFPVDTIAHNLAPGRHRVQIEVLPDKAAESSGHEFRLLGLAAVGVEQ